TGWTRPLRTTRVSCSGSFSYFAWAPHALPSLTLRILFAALPLGLRAFTDDARQQRDVFRRRRDRQRLDVREQVRELRVREDLLRIRRHLPRVVHVGGEPLHGHLHRHETRARAAVSVVRSEEHTSELQSRGHLVCRL